jgi:hypothetical protein
VLGVVISLGGGIAWLKADHEPLVAGKPIGLVVELRLPAGLEEQLKDKTDKPYLILHGGGTSTYGAIDFERARHEDGRWFVPGQTDIHNTSSYRMLNVTLHVVREQYFDLPLPAKPALSAQWSDWLTESFYNDRTAPPADLAYHMRYRIEHRPPPPPPLPPEPRQTTVEELKAAAFKALKPDAPVEDWLAFISPDTPYEIKLAAQAALAKRPDLGPTLARLIASIDQNVARDGTYFVGELKPPPRSIADICERIIEYFGKLDREAAGTK